MRGRPMTNECVICGRSPTVKSHLWPRALSHDLRGADKHLVSGRAGDSRIEFLQSGRWRYFLCDEHEGALRTIDDYGVKFIRRASVRSSKDFTIANPKPAELKRFALSVVWRFDAAERLTGKASALGPFETRIREAIFGEGAIEAPIVFIQPNILAQGDPIDIAMEPTKANLRGATVWKFDFGSLACIVKISGQDWPREWEVADAGNRTEALILSAPPSEIVSLPAYRPLLQQMQVFKTRG